MANEFGFSERDVRNRLVAMREWLLYGNELQYSRVHIAAALDLALDKVNVIPESMLLKVTEPLDMHPEGWEWSCMCAECRSCDDGSTPSGFSEQSK